MSKQCSICGAFVNDDESICIDCKVIRDYQSDKSEQRRKREEHFSKKGRIPLNEVVKNEDR